MKSSRDQLSLFDVAPRSSPRRAPVGVVTVAPELAQTAAALSPTIHLGTSSWSFPGWTGIVYDAEFTTQRLAREGLAAYARHPLLRAVGIDRTFYQPLPAGAFAEYADAVPPSFRFLVKAQDVCTTARFGSHARHGAQRGQANDKYLDANYATQEVIDPCVMGLADKLGVIVFQFPPQPASEVSSPQRFAERLHTFLRQLPRGPLYATELRNAELLTDDYAAVLRDVGACHCLNVHPTMPGLRAQAKITLDAESPALVVRWMLHSGFAYEEAKERYAPFNRLVDEDPTSRGLIADLCRRAAKREKRAYVVINNKAEGSSPLSVFRLAEAIAIGRLVSSIDL